MSSFYSQQRNNYADPIDKLSEDIYTKGLHLLIESNRLQKLYLNSELAQLTSDRNGSFDSYRKNNRGHSFDNGIKSNLLKESFEEFYNKPEKFSFEDQRKTLHQSYDMTVPKEPIATSTLNHRDTRHRIFQNKKKVTERSPPPFAVDEDIPMFDHKRIAKNFSGKKFDPSPNYSEKIRNKEEKTNTPYFKDNIFSSKRFDSSFERMESSNRYTTPNKIESSFLPEIKTTQTRHITSGKPNYHYEQYRNTPHEDTMQYSSYSQKNHNNSGLFYGDNLNDRLNQSEISPPKHPIYYQSPPPRSRVGQAPIVNLNPKFDDILSNRSRSRNSSRSNESFSNRSFQGLTAGRPSEKKLKNDIDIRPTDPKSRLLFTSPPRDYAPIVRNKSSKTDIKLSPVSDQSYYLRNASEARRTPTFSSKKNLQAFTPTKRIDLIKNSPPKIAVYSPSKSPISIPSVFKPQKPKLESGRSRLNKLLQGRSPPKK